jgi:hypothetical protein
LVHWIEAPARDQALGQAEGHGGVVGPLAGLQAEGPAADHVLDGREGAPRLEFQGGAKGITDCQSEDGAPVPVNQVHGVFG